VATPGRLLSFVNWGVVNLQRTRMAVIDEGDKMMNMGFFPDMKAIFHFLPATRNEKKYGVPLPSPFFLLGFPLFVMETVKLQYARMTAIDDKLFYFYFLFSCCFPLFYISLIIVEASPSLPPPSISSCSFFFSQ
jgi:hypothetical protein